MSRPAPLLRGHDHRSLEPPGPGRPRSRRYSPARRDGGPALRACFVDAGEALAAVMERRRGAEDMPVTVNRQPDIRPEQLPAVLAGHEIAIIDHTALPTDIAKRCEALRHVVFLGTG